MFIEPEADERMEMQEKEDERRYEREEAAEDRVGTVRGRRSRGKHGWRSSDEGMGRGAEAKEG